MVPVIAEEAIKVELSAIGVGGLELTGHMIGLVAKNAGEVDMNSGKTTT